MALASSRNGEEHTETYAWDEAVREYLLHVRAVRAEDTFRFYRCQLRQLVLWAHGNDVPFDGFGKRHLDRYLLFRRQQGKAVGTLEHDAVAAKAFFGWCAKNDLLNRNPLGDYKVSDKARPERYMPTEDEIRALLAAVGDFYNPAKNGDIRYFTPARRAFCRDRAAALVLGLLDSSGRIGEMLSVKLGDVNVKEREVTFRETKGKAPRVVPVSQEWLDVLQEWKKQRAKVMAKLPRGRGRGWLFVNEYGSRMDEGHFLKALKRYLKFAGLSDKITLHALRRFGLNRLSKKNLFIAQAIAGHKDPKTTMAYTKLDAADLRGLHDDVGVVRGIVTSKRPARRTKLV